MVVPNQNRLKSRGQALVDKKLTVYRKALVAYPRDPSCNQQIIAVMNSFKMVCHHSSQQTTQKSFIGDAQVCKKLEPCKFGIRKKQKFYRVHLEKEVLRIEDNLIMIGSKVALSTPKTPKSRRTLKLAPELLEVLRLHQAAQAQRHFKYGLTPERDWLFTSTVGTVSRPDNIMREFKSLCEVAQVRRVRLHDLRHTWATLSRRAGVPLEDVSAQLGHSRPSFTGDVYIHPDNEETRAINLSELLADRPRRN